MDFDYSGIRLGYACEIGLLNGLELNSFWLSPCLVLSFVVYSFKGTLDIIPTPVNCLADAAGLLSWTFLFSSLRAFKTSALTVSLFFG